MIKVSTLVIFFLFCSVFLQAQVIENKQDSISTHRSSGQKAYKAAGIIIPTGMIAYGCISLGDNKIRQLDFDTRDKLLEENYIIHLKADDYVQYFPAAFAFGLKAVGVENKNKWSDMAILGGLSFLTNAGIVHVAKYSVGRPRPDNGALNSFPSGHTSTAFVAAEFLHQEFRDNSIWISIGGYSVATAVGVSRVFRNRHWVSDVVAGAGIGVLSTKAVYWAYPYIKKPFTGKNKNVETVVFPTYNNGNFGLAFYGTF